MSRSTAHANSWTVNVWYSWARYHNTLQHTQGDNYFPVPVDFVGASTEQLDYWLSFFVMEIRRQDCKSYPANTLFNIVAGIQRHLHTTDDYITIFHFFLSVLPFLGCTSHSIVA